MPPMRAVVGVGLLVRAAPLYTPKHTALRLLSSSTASTQLTPSTILNPPASTLPPPLSVPERTPDQSTPSYLFSTGKAYLGFYKSGLRAVWDNYRAAAAQFDSKVRAAGFSHVDAAAAGGVLTRSEWQLARRASADVRRIPLFALLFAVCGEFTPLVVVFAGALVPYTCRIPKQVEVERKKRAARRRESRGERVGAAKVAGKEVVLSSADLGHIGRRLDLYGRIWDRAAGGMPGMLLSGRVQRRLGYLQLDNELLGLDGPQVLADDEVRVACEERGIDVLDSKDQLIPTDTLRQQLSSWLRAAKKQPLEELILA